MNADIKLDDGAVSNSPAKFAIGAVAGFCAAVLPRFLAQLAQSDISRVTFFPDAYLVAAGVFAVFMGSVVVIFEWKVPTRPRDTFMTALALPGVVAGAIGTASGVSSLGDVKRETDQLKREISQHQGILKEGTLPGFQPLEPGPSPMPQSRSYLPSLIGSAYAQSNVVEAPRDKSMRFGIHVDEPKYVVVLKQTPNSAEAISLAQKYRQHLPQAQAVKSGNSYLVILGGIERNETDALIDAARAKNKLGDSGLQPKLVQIQK